MISGNTPEHLVVAARTGFLSGQKGISYPWQRIASMIDLGAKSVDLVDLGAAPMPTQNKGKGQVQEFIEKTLKVEPLDWDITVSLSHNAIQDDQTSSLERKVMGAGANFQKHIGKLAFKALNAGDATTYGLCYDGLYMFSNSHVDKGAQYTTVQDNLYGLTLSLDNFQTVRVAALGTMDDQGEKIGYDYNLLVVPPALEYTAAQICTNAQAYDTANREMNPYSGSVSYIVNPELDSTAWMLVASNESVKPILIAMREQPNLQHTWFDPNGPDGGMYYFKFYARYNVFYGDWRTAYMGNS